MGKIIDGLKDKAPGLHKFLTRTDKPYPVVREVTLGGLGLAVAVALLFGLTAQPLIGGYPVVVVTTGSMMHCTNGTPSLGKDCDPESYGRLGTIDPGDLVFVRHVKDASAMSSMTAADHSTYGKPGDVVVYRPNGNTQVTPIIHRALFYVQINADGTYTVPELNLDHVGELNQPEIRALTSCDLTPRPHVLQWGPEDSGFITRGDNNGFADQCHGVGFGYRPATATDVLGKARGEVPWIGLVNLLFGDITGGSNNFSNAGGDSKVMLLVVAIVVFGGPWGYDRFVRRRRAA